MNVIYNYKLHIKHPRWCINHTQHFALRSYFIWQSKLQ